MRSRRLDALRYRPAEEQKAVRFDVNMPEQLPHQIDVAANARKMTQSAFLILAAEQDMRTHA